MASIKRFRPLPKPQVGDRFNPSDFMPASIGYNALIVCGGSFEDGFLLSALLEYLEHDEGDGSYRRKSRGELDQCNIRYLTRWFGGEEFVKRSFRRLKQLGIVELGWPEFRLNHERMSLIFNAVLAGEKLPARSKPSWRRPISIRLRFKVLKKHGFCCGYCGVPASKAELELDHIVPGGQTTEDNLIPACKDCNLGKSNIPLEEAK